MMAKEGLVSISSYLIPKALAKSVDKKGIRLRITAYEALRDYLYAKMKRLATFWLCT
jgi:hypothetical protein